MIIKNIFFYILNILLILLFNISINSFVSLDNSKFKLFSLFSFGLFKLRDKIIFSILSDLEEIDLEI